MFVPLWRVVRESDSSSAIDLANGPADKFAAGGDPGQRRASDSRMGAARNRAGSVAQDSNSLISIARREADDVHS